MNQLFPHLCIILRNHQFLTGQAGQTVCSHGSRDYSTAELHRLYDLIL